MPAEVVTQKVTVGVRSFPYMVEVPHPYEPDKTMRNDRTGNRGQEIEVFPEDYERGVRLNAFMREGETVEDFAQIDKSEFNAVDATDTELINWIKDDNPTVQEVVDASDGDEETALRLLSAENSATGNDPRKGVVAGLEAIVTRANS